MSGVNASRLDTDRPNSNPQPDKQSGNPLWIARQPYREFAELAALALEGDAAAVLLGHDVVADRQAQTGALTGGLGREERLNSGSSTPLKSETLAVGFLLPGLSIRL
jgi:hypothetical protein